MTDGVMGVKGQICLAFGVSLFITAVQPVFAQTNLQLWGNVTLDCLKRLF